jgi:hypothetical protein
MMALKSKKYLWSFIKYSMWQCITSKFWWYVKNGLINTSVANFLGISKFVANRGDHPLKLNQLTYLAFSLCIIDITSPCDIISLSIWHRLVCISGIVSSPHTHIDINFYPLPWPGWIYKLIIAQMWQSYDTCQAHLAVIPVHHDSTQLV